MDALAEAAPAGPATLGVPSRGTVGGHRGGLESGLSLWLSLVLGLGVLSGLRGVIRLGTGMHLQEQYSAVARVLSGLNELETGGGPRWTRTTYLRVISTALYLMS